LKKQYASICPINRYFRDRREEEELVLRFFAFAETFDKLEFTDMSGAVVSKHNEGTDDYLTAFYKYQNQKLKELNGNDSVSYEKEIKKLETNFTNMLEFVRDKFPYGFRREHSKSVARVVFEAISVGVHLALLQNSNLATQKVNTDWVRSDNRFKNSINQKYGLHQANKIIERINIVKNNLLNAQQ